VKYLLDTNIVSYATRGEGNVMPEIRRRRASILAVSVITLAEDRFGWKRNRSKRLEQAAETFFATITVLDFDRMTAVAYADLAASLADTGRPIGIHDTMIAAHALATKRVLVTHNVKHFEHIPGLQIDDWY
jgi:tRNA(fMet)-specific endonuclease VapC